MSTAIAPQAPIQQVFGLAELAGALGRSRTHTWYLVQASMEADLAGGRVNRYLLPALFLVKGERIEVLFTAEQIAAARSAFAARGQPAFAARAKRAPERTWRQRLLAGPWDGGAPAEEAGR